YHVVSPPYTGNFVPPKYDLVPADEEEYVFNESVTTIPDVTTSEAKTSVSKPKSVGEPLIEDWISDSEDQNETEFNSKQRKPSFAKIEFVKSNEHMKTPRESINQRNWNNLRTKSMLNTLGKMVKALEILKKLMVDLLHLEEIPKEVESLVKKNSVLFTNTECVVLSPDLKLLDENHVLLRVPRKDNMYSIDLKNIVP
ncbi:hypothetical protein Tco_0943505, partial [Tanacetum coccineum]